MKAFGFLSASSAEISQIDHKLLLFQEIFQGTYRVATHAKESLGSFGTSFKGIADTLSSIYRDPVYSQVTDQSEVLKVVGSWITHIQESSFHPDLRGLWHLRPKT